MGRYYYDLHIHSCLSPCGDDDMTPANIAGMAALNGLQIVALTDHNSTKNCPGFFEACKRNGLIPIPGMELTTAEEIHLICLFDELQTAVHFGEEIDGYLIPVKNRPKIFGEQIIMDGSDTVLGEVENLLLTAATLPVERAYELCSDYGGACFPAHIDREANGIVAILGAFPEEPAFSCFELNDSGNLEKLKKAYPILNSLRELTSSDAHRLWEISDAVNSIELDDEPYSGENVRKALIKLLREGDSV